ncbi:FAD-dependent oxidoreductase [Conexibacter stalactiti]|uniref:FAD-dependent oxidoreductase n=1 Tax=Conexibacter stalactiti TaxID=1940611 RepID=A0ABU4HL61_9ACTN|nr:FAD-dependent oxidoreductase [Conexibacter stalactiti]MDW5594041.1 FAD-dependent oxidoreductase [Conexibacter stalactiti]MEC5034683.1 FAD-dependent oxidoreductase [Conexibacter stalactiti]
MTATLPARADVVVIGGGVVGLATARELAGAGRDVVVLEQFALDHTRGGSHGDARVFAYVHPEPEWVPMAVESMRLWRELEAEAGERLLDDSGGLYATERASLLTPALTENGVAFELLSAAATAERFPVTLPAGKQAIWTPQAATIFADRALLALAASVRTRGGAIHERTPVTALRRTPGGPGRVELETAAGAIRAETVVVAAGGWAGPLLAQAGVELPLVTRRGTVAYFPFRAGERIPPPLFEEGSPSIYSATSPGHGLKLGESRIGPTVDPDAPWEPDAESAARLAQRVRERFPTAVPSDPHLEIGLFGNLPEPRFVLEEHDGVIAAAACEGRGFKFAPLTGARLAALATAPAVR